MRILITGGSGFIGSHLVDHFQGLAEIVVLDNLRSGHRQNLAGLEYEFIDGSVTDPEAVGRAMKGVEIVFHLAAMISVPESMENPRECLKINGIGLLNVLEAAADAGVRKVVLASSAAIYGDNPVVPKCEPMLPEPKSPYAITKLDGEYYLELFRRAGKLDTASVRFFNVFGPRQDPKSAYAAAVPIFMQNALANEDLAIFGNGEQTRDFVHVKDVVSAMVHVATHRDLNGTFNVGYGTSITVSELANYIIRLSGSSSKIVHFPERPGDVRHSRASIDKLLATGFRHASSLEQGLAETLDYFRSGGIR
ncbi:MAG: NAD-dependent epimerase/dehydratase family protein [Luteolibacter sp.]|uniref:NAD-dependent epimerase/dehydratase family protein n=1 Tax=Luteolibacter sp. TaxID=1962973 RepID=UPI003267AC2D